MSTPIMETSRQVVCLGAGYMSGVVAAECIKAGLSVVAITKGPYWDFVNDFSTTKYDEWGVGLGRKYDSPLPLQSTTIRNNTSQFALPVRRYTMPIQYHTLGHGVGGAAQHYGGTMGRQGPWGYHQLSSTLNNPNYGSSFLPSNHDLEDWPLAYSDYVPFYEQWELAHGLCGTRNGSPNDSSQTDNATGPNFPWMRHNYPLTPHPLTPLSQTFHDATQALGYHPFPHVSSLASEATVNQYGVPINPCVYDGYCGGPCDYACETGAKANAAYRTFPYALKKPDLFTLVTNAYIFRLDYDSVNHIVTHARYYDAEGRVHIQPGTAFFNGMWGYNMIRIMLLSGVGDPYQPTPTPSGTVGRGLTNGYLPYRGTSVTGTLTNVGGNNYPAGNGSGGGIDIYDLMDDNFDHSAANPKFIGGSQISIGTYLGGGPGNITFAGGVGAPSSTNPNGSMGSTFKATQKDRCLPTKTTLASTPFAHDIPTQDHYVDLDPHFTDAYGDPISRLTYDWSDNTYNGATFLAPLVAAIFTKMGAQNVTVGSTVAAGSAHNDWWGHHLRGGCRIGANPMTSVFNLWNQCWSMYTSTSGHPAYNYFGAGEITNTSGDNVPSGTHVAGPQSYVAAEGIQNYLTLIASGPPGVLPGKPTSPGA